MMIVVVMVMMRVPLTSCLLFTTLAPHGDRFMHFTVSKKGNSREHIWLCAL
jgi:hypothetical protein